MSETRGPAFSDVERAALATAAETGLRPAEVSRSAVLEPAAVTLLLEVLEARLADVECRFEARMMALERRALHE